MVKPKVLYVTQEVKPYLPSTHMSTIGRQLPQSIQESKKEIRVFMPRFGLINERRNQLHEVIRLSGMNLIINDMDHPLIIKVASIQSARMQVYFIDNEDYFHRKFVFRSKKGEFFPDNDERAIFYARGVIETVKKLSWAPDIIHVHGWFGSLVPMYLRRIFQDNPLFTDSKIVLSIYNDGFDETLDDDFVEKLQHEGLDSEDMLHYKEKSYVGMLKSAIDLSDAIIFAETDLNPEIEEYANNSGKKILNYVEGDACAKAYNNFYDELLEKEEE
ncbi:MAG: glycogen synthase [Bacteroidetes bacterium 4572_112]|nr:MAG: glycogen synthase [Bacteroidetes bacterium 4572_112]